MVLAIGATVARDLPVPGRELDGIHQAMEYLPQANRVSLGEAVEDQIPPTASTSSSSAAATPAPTASAPPPQGAASVTQLEIMPSPGTSVPTAQPWPTYPMIFRVSAAHEEGGDRVYAVSTKEFLGDDDGRVRALRLVEVDMSTAVQARSEGTEREIPAELVLLAMGFTGPERDGLVEQLGVDLDDRGNVARDDAYRTSVPGVFVAGDAGRGQSLIVWAIAEGRAARRRRRRVPDRLHQPAGADPADRAAARRLAG